MENEFSKSFTDDSCWRHMGPLSLSERSLIDSERRDSSLADSDSSIPSAPADASSFDTTSVSSFSSVPRSLA